MMERNSRTAASADAATRRVRTGSLLAVVTFGTAALAALVVALGTVVVGRLDAATDVNALVAEARRQADSVDELGAVLGPAIRGGSFRDGKLLFSETDGESSPTRPGVTTPTAIDCA